MTAAPDARCSGCGKPCDTVGRYCRACRAAYMRERRDRQHEAERWFGGIAFALLALKARKGKKKTRNVSCETIERVLNETLKI